MSPKRIARKRKPRARKTEEECITVVEEGREYYHFRINEPELFVSKEIRTPSWFENIANKYAPGAKVRTGPTKEGKWLVQAILIPMTYSRKEARKRAMQIAYRMRAC